MLANKVDTTSICTKTTVIPSATSRPAHFIRSRVLYRRPPLLYLTSSTLLFFSNSQDVTNAGGNRGGNNAGKASKSVVVAKRNNGVKTRSETRSMSIGGSNGAQEVVLQRAGTFGSLHAHEDRNPTASNRDAMSYPRGEIHADPDSYQMTGNTDDIDERDAEDPLCATGYVSEMYVLFRENEVASSVRPVYMEGQPHINERMRSILVDWLIEVHLKFKLVPETLYLTINLIDRYLQLKEVSRPKLQLVGVTSLLIASKYEEIYPPELRDLVYICDRAYTRQDVSRIEPNQLLSLLLAPLRPPFSPPCLSFSASTDY
jgi:hypothetical protein